jgi:hypothetical protein
MSSSKDKRFAAGYAAGLAAGLAGFNPGGFSEEEMLQVQRWKSDADYNGRSWRGYCEKILNPTGLDEDTEEVRAHRMRQRQLLARYLEKYPLIFNDNRY